MSLVKVKLNLTDQQKKKLADSAMKCTSCKLNLKHSQLDGKDEVQITKTQAGRINKAKNDKKGLQLTFSQQTLKKNKTGGFLSGLIGPLLKYVLPAVAPTILENTIFKSNKEGSGLYNYGEGCGCGKGMKWGDLKQADFCMNCKDGKGLKMGYEIKKNYPFGAGMKYGVADNNNVFGLKTGKGLKMGRELEKNFLSQLQSGNGLYNFGEGFGKFTEALPTYNI